MTRKAHPKSLRPDPEAEAAERRRLIRILSIGFVVALVLACALVFGMGRTRLLTEEGKGVLAGYEKVRAALADDALEPAKQAAADLALRFADRRPTAQPAQEIAAAADLKAARLAFVELSEDAIRLARGHEGYFLVRCPIQNCPEPCKGCPMAHYGPWVQVAPEVANPYMGRAHLRCGVILP
jgi:hypothetical protein